MLVGWEPEPERHGWFRCLPCEKAVYYRYLGMHEGSASHEKCLSIWMLRNQSQRMMKQAGPSGEPDRPSSQASQLRGHLSQILANLAQRNQHPNVAPLCTPEVMDRPLEVDWSATAIRDYHQEASYETNAVSALADDLQRHILDPGAVDADSDDENAEVDDAEGGIGEEHNSLVAFEN